MDKARHGAGTKQEGARRTWGRNAGRADRDVRYAVGRPLAVLRPQWGGFFLRQGRPVRQAVPETRLKARVPLHYLP